MYNSPYSNHRSQDPSQPKIVVIGLGGGGSNAVNRADRKRHEGCYFRCRKYRCTGT